MENIINLAEDREVKRRANYRIKSARIVMRRYKIKAVFYSIARYTLIGIGTAAAIVFMAALCMLDSDDLASVMLLVSGSGLVSAISFVLVSLLRKIKPLLPMGIARVNGGLVARIRVKATDLNPERILFVFG